MRRDFIRASVAIATILAAMPGAAAAQTAGQFIFTPYVGAYVPSSDLGSFRDRVDGIPLTAKLKHESAFALGLNASYWMNDRVAIELGTAYAMTDLTGTVRSDWLDTSLAARASPPVGGGDGQAEIRQRPARSPCRRRSTPAPSW